MAKETDFPTVQEDSLASKVAKGQGVGYNDLGHKQDNGAWGLLHVVATNAAPAPKEDVDKETPAERKARDQAKKDCLAQIEDDKNMKASDLAAAHKEFEQAARELSDATQEVHELVEKVNNVIFWLEKLNQGASAVTSGLPLFISGAETGGLSVVLFFAGVALSKLGGDSDAETVNGLMRSAPDIGKMYGVEAETALQEAALHDIGIINFAIDCSKLLSYGAEYDNYSLDQIETLRKGITAFAQNGFVRKQFTPTNGEINRTLDHYKDAKQRKDAAEKHLKEVEARTLSFRTCVALKMSLAQY